jgi:hypothetical protein
MATNQPSNYTFTAQNSPNKLKELQDACGLSNITDPTITTFYLTDTNKFAAQLDMLVSGFNSIGHVWAIAPGDPFYITGYDPQDPAKCTYNNFIGWMDRNNLLEKCKKLTPAGKKGELTMTNRLGAYALGTSMMHSNAMSGPSQNTPPLMDALLNSIDPNMVTNIENVCNIIRSRSYFSLPASAFGSLQTLLYKAQGAVQGFVEALYNLYQGLISLMRKFAIMINGYIAMFNQWVYDFICQYIDLDLICSILGAAQSLLDDAAFFAQLFDGGDGMFNAINSIQTVINYAAETLAYAYNPITLLNLIPGVGNIMAQFDQLLGDPEAFMGNLITQFGLGNVGNNKALQIANAIILRYGLQSQLGPLGPILLQAGVAGNSSQWYRTGNLGTGTYGQALAGPIGNIGLGSITYNPGYFDPNNPLAFLDVNSNPYFNAAKTNIADFTNNVKDLPGAFANFVTNPLG